MRWIIGDVHGCLKELQELTNKIRSLDTQAQIYSVGDLVNKGPDTWGVLEFCLQEEILWIQGNHEQWLIKQWKLPTVERKTKAQKILMDPRAQNHLLTVLEAAPFWLEWPDLLMVHAGLDPRWDHPRDMQPKILTTIRTWDGLGENLDCPKDPPWYEVRKWQWEQIVFGHWALQGKVDLPQIKGLDTGCVYGGLLSAWCVETQKWLHIESHGTYVKLDF